MKFLAAFLLAGTSVAAAQSIDEFAFAVPIEGTAGEPFYRLIVPQPVYEGAAFADLRDLRVYNGADEPVPHALRAVAAASQKPAPVPLALFPLQGPGGTRAEDLDLEVDRTGGRLSVRMQSHGGADSRKPGRKVLLGYLIDASKVDSPLAGLRFELGARGPTQLGNVRLETSSDLRAWTLLVSEAPLGRLVHDGRQLQRDVVEFSPRRVEYLRLTWRSPGDAVDIAGVQGLVPEQSTPVERMWKSVIATPVADAAGDYAFDLGGHFPLDRLALHLPQENTVVPVQVLARNDSRQKWMPVASTVAYRLRADGREVTSAPVALAPHARRHWLLRVDRKAGGIGAGNIEVRAGWLPRELVFNARGSAPFRLAYGNAHATATSLGVETLVPGWRTDEAPDIPLVATGATQKLPGTAAAGLAPADRKKLGLWAALAAGVAVLAWMAWQLARQLNKSGAK